MYNFLKIPFDPLRSQQPTLVNITQKPSVPTAVLGASSVCAKLQAIVSFQGRAAPPEDPGNQKWQVGSFTCELDQYLHL